MEQKTNDFLQTEKIGKLMRQFAIPCVISLIVGALYNIVDQIFIANASYLGSYGNAANTVVFPLTVLALGIAFYMFGQAMNPIIRSDGSPKFAMASTLAGAVANIILDPIFIYGFKWGMMGAAVATVLGQVLTAVLAAWYLCHMKAVRPEKSSFHLKGSLIVRFLSLSMTSLLAQVSLVISMAAVQNTCMKYGAMDPIFGQQEYAQIPLAVLGIVMKFFQIAISVAIGMAAGCIPIVGYNIGAERKDRAKTLFTYLLAAEAAVGAVVLIIVECFPLQIANLFGAANESVYYADFAVKCFRIYLCMMVLATVNKGTFIYLQALGKAAASTIVYP